jgi:hypothetical protein
LGDELFFAFGIFNTNMTDFNKVAFIEISLVSDNWTGKPASFVDLSTGERIMGLHPCSKDDLMRFYQFDNQDFRNNE